MAQQGGWRRQLRSLFSWGWRFGPGPVPATTVELPLTRAHVFALRHHVRAERQFFVGAVAAVVTFILLLPALPIRLRSEPVPIGFILAIATGVIIVSLLIDWFGWSRGHEAEIRRGVYYRISGPIRVYFRKSDNGTQSIQVGDIEIKHVPVDASSTLRDLPFGYIDYAPRSRVVVEQRDADGELLYRSPAYRPDDDPVLTRRLPSLLAPIIWGAVIALVVVLGMTVLFVWAQGRR